MAVTAGYICPEPRRELFAHMDAANVDLKGFSEDFYQRLCAGDLETVKDSLRYLVRETRVWTEITTLLIPGANDGDDEIDALSRWVAEELGLEVPLHFTAFHPDYKLTDRPPTPPRTLTRARDIALGNGLKHVYTGNVRDREGGSTFCAGCGALLIEREGYDLGDWRLDTNGRCASCGHPLAGLLEPRPGSWGSRRRPVRIGG